MVGAQTEVHHYLYPDTLLHHHNVNRGETRVVSPLTDLFQLQLEPLLSTTIKSRQCALVVRKESNLQDNVCSCILSTYDNPPRQCALDVTCLRRRQACCVVVKYGAYTSTPSTHRRVISPTYGLFWTCRFYRNAVRNRTSLNSSISHQATPVTSLLGFVDDTPTTCWVLDPVWHVIEPRMFDCNP